MQTQTVEIRDKVLLTIKEAAEYTGVGEKTLRRLVQDDDRLACWVGHKCMIKRRKIEDFLLSAYSI